MFRITVLGSLGLYSFDWGNFYAERNFFFSHLPTPLVPTVTVPSQIVAVCSLVKVTEDTNKRVQVCLLHAQYFIDEHAQ